MNPLHLVTLLLAAVCCSCIAPVTVTEVDTPDPQHPVEIQTMDQHRAHPRSDAHAAAGELLEGIHQAARTLRTGDESALSVYNYLTSRLVEHLSETQILTENGARLPATETTYTLRLNKPEDLTFLHRRIYAADRINFYGRHAYAESVKPGIGAPIVSTKPIDDDLQLELSDYYRNLTALVRFRGNQAELFLADPYKVESFDVGNRHYELAANYSATASLMLSHERIDKLGFVRLLNPSKFDNTSRITAVQPYDPERIPVIFVHGLQDSPSTWAPMYFGLMADEKIRTRYQFWTFSYPSGYPYPKSASIFRDELAKVRALYPDHKDIVLIGHSMGGLISRLMITDAGEQIWKGIFGQPPSVTPIEGPSAEILTKAAIFSAQPQIDRVIYIAAPHQGSEMARGVISLVASKIVTLPDTFADLRDDLVFRSTADRAGMALDRVPNSIDTLSPGSLFIQQVNKIPTEPHVPVHSIIGDLGLGSDGVVAYWSSHIENAESEKIITATHYVHQHPEAIREAHRILLDHVGLPPSPLILPSASENRPDLIKGRGPRSKR